MKDIIFTPILKTLLASIVVCLLIGPNVALLIAPIIIYFLIRFIIDIYKMIRCRIFNKVIYLRLLNFALIVSVFTIGHKVYKNFGIQVFRKTVVAVKSYHAKNNNYPSSIEALVPKFLEDVPKPYFCVFGPKIFYKLSLDRSTEPLMLLPLVSPFYRVSYLFRENRELYLD